MSISYDFYKQSGALKSTDKVYTKVISKTTTTTDDITQLIEKSCTLTRSDIKAALSALSETLTAQLLSGNRVQLDGIGTFAVKMDGEIKRNKDGRLWVKDAHVKNIQFHPDKCLMQQMQNAEFTSQHHAGHHSQELTTEEILTKIRALQAHGPFFTVGQLRQATGLTATRTYQLVHTLTDQGILENISPNKNYLLRLKEG